MRFEGYNESQILRIFKVHEKVHSANNRFEDKIDYYDVLNLLKRFDFYCFYCGNELEGFSWQLDHFHPRCNGGKNTFDNLAPTCRWCNQLKNGLDGNAFIEKCRRVVANNYFVRILINN